ncbi:membrane protein insertion efficiency factor YidD [bacterium]|nr:membrane protein insertion efficiency factor YidD [bacterium]
MKRYLILIFICCLFIPSALFCENIYWPYESKFDNAYIIKHIIRDAAYNNSKGYPYSTNILLNPIALYHRSLSNSSCQYYPSCSRYTYLSIDKYGSIKGLILGAERFTRCFYLADASKYFRVGPFYYDPPADYFGCHPDKFSHNTYEIFLHDNLQKYLAYASNTVSLDETIYSRIETEFDSLLFLFSFKGVDDDPLDFACFLYQSHKYYQASTELYRFLYRHQNNENSDEVLLLLALCNFQSGRYADAANLFANSNQYAIQDRMIIFSKYMQGLALYYDCRYPESKTLLSQLLSLQNSYFRKQILTMYSLSCIKMNDRASALSMLERFPEDEHALTLKASFTKKKAKSPLFASVLSSIVPGSGQFYSNHYREGLFALLVNGLFGYTFFDSCKNGTSSDKIFHGFLFLQFYSSNILAGKRAAIVSNEISNENIISNMISKTAINTDYSLIKKNNGYYIKVY